MIGNDFTIISVTRDDRGVWSALVGAADDVVVATRRHGSWSWLRGETEVQCLPHVAASLQARVREADARILQPTTTTAGRKPA